MERSEPLLSIKIWNGAFQTFPLTMPDLKKPHSMMGAYLQVLSRMGIDIDVVLAPPPEDELDDHTMYYWDLLPVINMTRVMNHLASKTPALHQDKSPLTFPLSITHFLQPDQAKSHSLLLLLVNLLAFNENRSKDIEPYVSQLFGKRSQVQKLEESKNRLLGMLNERAEEKGKRAERLEKLNHDVKQFEEELKPEKEAFCEEQQELEAVEKELQQTVMLLEQKKSHRDALLAEVARRKALRVYDAEDIRAQAAQAGQIVQEAEEKLESLQTALMQKGASLSNLQRTKPGLELANGLLAEVIRLSEELNEFESSDPEATSRCGQLDALGGEAARLRAQQAELRAARRELEAQRAEARARRQLQAAQLQSALREAEEQDKRSQEKTKKSIQIVKELKEITSQCGKEKERCFGELEEIKLEFIQELKSFEEQMLKKVSGAKKTLEKRLQDRRR